MTSPSHRPSPFTTQACPTFPSPGPRTMTLFDVVLVVACCPFVHFVVVLSCRRACIAPGGHSGMLCDVLDDR